MAQKKRVWSKAQLEVRAKYFTPRKLEAQKVRRQAGRQNKGGNRGKSQKQGRSK